MGAEKAQVESRGWCGCEDPDVDCRREAGTSIRGMGLGDLQDPRLDVLLQDFISTL
jgi:hypothetical protein